MFTLETRHSDNIYSQLPLGFYRRVEPTPDKPVYQLYDITLIEQALIERKIV